MEATNWHNIVLVRSSNTYTAYIDGNLECQGSSTAAINFNPRGLILGAGPEVIDSFSNGAMDEFIIWTRALSSAEVSRVSLLSTSTGMYVQNNACSCPPNYFLSSGTCQSTCDACYASDPNHVCTNGNPITCSCRAPLVTTAISNHVNCDCPSNYYGNSCQSNCTYCLSQGSNRVCTSGLSGSCVCAPGFILASGECVVACLDPTSSIYSGAISLWHLDGDVTPAIGSLSSSLVGQASYANGGALGLSLSVSNSYVNIPNVPSLTDFTYALFFKGEESNGWRFLLTHDGADYNTNALVITTNGGRVRLSIGTYFSDVSSSCNTILPSTDWVHLAVTRAGNNVTIFIDGAVECTGISSIPIGSATGIQLGRGPGPLDSFTSGSIDEVLLSSRALTQAEILQLATNTVTPCYTVNAEQQCVYNSGIAGC